MILTHLGRILSSVGFRRAERSSALLRYLVEQTVDGRADRLKEYTLGVEALGRDETFDPRMDPIVRAEASRLRSRLERYYETEGEADDLVIRLPKGGYVPQFARRAAPPIDDADPANEAPLHKPSRRPPAWVALAVLLAAVALVAVWWAWAVAPSPGEAPLLQFDVELKAEGTLSSEVGTDMVLSPDGNRLVFVTRDPDGLTHLNTRRLDEASAQASAARLPETRGARNPFLSPDGRWVGYWAGGKIKKTSVEGGSPVDLCDATDLFGASWEDEGSIIAALHPTFGLWRVPAAGGVPELILDLSEEGLFPAWPQVMPGGEFMVYTTLAGFGADRANVELRAVRGGERKVLVRGGTFGRYLASGHLIYVNQGTLYAAPFDVGRLEVSGAAVPILENISYSRTFGYAQVAVSQSDRLAYRHGGESDRFQVEWIERTGKTAPLLAGPGRYEYLRLSPDGKRLAYSQVESGAVSIWVYDAGRDDLKRVTSAADAYNSLVWWPEGNFLVLGGRTGMAWVDAGRPGKPRPLTTGSTIQVPWSFTPDRKRLAYYELNPTTGFDLWTVPVKGGADGLEFGNPEPLLQTPAFAECYPSISPDGGWLAYTSNESGVGEIYVRAFPDNGKTVRVSTAGGNIPKWSPNRRELLYRTWDHRVMVVSYGIVGGAFVAGTPRPWSQRQIGDTGVLPNFDVAPDGERIAALMPVTRPEDRQSQNHVTFLLNFSAEVRRRLSPPRASR